MIRIVGIQRDICPHREFVLLQNQGSMRTSLRGHAIVGEEAIQQPGSSSVHLFSEDVWISPGQYVLLYTGSGHQRWGRTKDGAHAYFAYANRRTSVWANSEGPIHILGTQHTFTERRELLAMA